MVFAGLGTVLAEQGDISGANRYWDEAEELFDALDDDYGRALTAVRRGAFESRLGNHTRALVLLERSLAWRAGISDRAGEAESLDQLGQANYRAGRMSAAHSSWSRAHSLFEALGVPKRHEVNLRLSAMDLVKLD